MPNNSSTPDWDTPRAGA